MVLLVLTLVSVLGLAIMGITLNNMKMSTNERTYQSTYYIAESGVNYMVDKVNKRVLDIYQTSTNEMNFFTNVERMITELNNEPPYKNFENSFGQKPEAKIIINTVTDSNSNPFREYKITSTGKINNLSRTVEKQIRVTWFPKNTAIIPDTAVFVNGTISLTGGAGIIGGAGTNSSAPSSITLDGGAGITGKIYVGPNSGDKVIKKPDYIKVDKETKLPQTRPIEMFTFDEFPSFPYPSNKEIIDGYNKHFVINNGSLNIDSWMANNYTLKMTNDMQFRDINITQNNTLIIDIGNKNKIIVVNHLNIPTGHIKITGTGKLTIYIQEKITLGSGSINEPTNKSNNQLVKDQIKKLDIFYKGPSLTMGADMKIYSSFYAQQANLTMTAGSSFQGHIVTGGSKVTINGGANAVTQLFYAPNADVVFSGGGNLTGAIIGKSFKGDGGSKVTFENINVEDLPPFIGGSNGGNISIGELISSNPSREK